MTQSVLLVRHGPIDLDLAVAAEFWQLSAEGRELAERLAALPIFANLQAVWCSPEPKAQATGRPLADRHSAAFLIHPHLAELQRGPSTISDQAGYEAAVRQAFAEPETSSGGWERAADAQRRIVAVVKAIADQASGPVAIVSHGLVLSLLVAHLRGAAFVDIDAWRALPLPALAVLDRASWYLSEPFQSVKNWENKTFF